MCEWTCSSRRRRPTSATAPAIRLTRSPPSPRASASARIIGRIDIGCGIGKLTIPLARHAGRVVAIDPVVTMLDRGRQEAQAAGLTNVAWVVGHSGRLAELVEPGARAATFAASFYWTDRDETLDALDGLLAPGGSVVVLGDDLDEDEQPDWDRAIADVRRRYPGLEPAPGAVTRMPEGHREVLERSAFSRVEASTWSWTRPLTVDEVIGLHLTYSFSSPARLGDRVIEFCADVRDAVLALYPGGLVTEPFRLEVLVATRA